MPQLMCHQVKFKIPHARHGLMFHPPTPGPEVVPVLLLAERIGTKQLTKYIHNGQGPIDLLPVLVKAAGCIIYKILYEKSF